MQIFVTGSAKVNLSDSASGKAIKLLSILKSRNLKLTLDSKADFLLAIDHNKSDYARFISEGGVPERAFLVRLEPPTVFPAQYRKSMEKKYAHIFTPGSIFQDSKYFLGWPYQKHANPNNPILTNPLVKIPRIIPAIDFGEWVKREVMLTMIAANKVAPAFGENYSLRRKFARNLVALEFNLYGPLWSESIQEKLKHRFAVAYFAIRHGSIPNITSIYGNLLFKYPRSLGTIEDKHQILGNSKFSLVIENSNTYVSEKLFDSILNGCIPIYFGPRISEVGLPPEIVIYYDGPTCDLIDFLSKIDEARIKQKLSTISEFLNSKIFEEFWMESKVYSKMADVICSYIWDDSLFLNPH